MLLIIISLLVFYFSTVVGWPLIVSIAILPLLIQGFNHLINTEKDLIN